MFFIVRSYLYYEFHEYLLLWIMNYFVYISVVLSRSNVKLLYCGVYIRETFGFTSFCIVVANISRYE